MARDSVPDPFVHRIRVRYAEIDGQGVVFNAHWLTYFDDSCTRFMESLGFGPEFWTKEFDVMLVRAVLEWSGPARFDDWIDVAVEPVRLGTRSFDLRYRAEVAGAPACAATITYVAVVPGANTSIEIPAQVRAALEPRSAPPA
jgi:acyl-CoA thioester hydrolase